jgi:hypothetical protein
MTVYTANIPQSGDQISQSQPLILANFQSLQDAQDRNHVALSDTVNRGKHNFVEMPAQGSTPVTAVGEIELHGKAIGGTTQLYCSRDNDVGTLTQLTTAIVPLVATSGYSFIPGGMIIQWGQVNFSGSTGVVNFPTAFPVDALMVVASPFNANAGASSFYISTWNSTTFTIKKSGSSSTSFTYYAVGH